ncbi:unnamed protein product [Rhizoctonia solani]|uniref:ribonuclease H n=1 Tax=Rhizoctonia solani TaxID=456999 RepID=A0A8H3E6R7_9AGAM|nr:unnamed protein product [Rhizoctonia solani]
MLKLWPSAAADGQLTPKASDRKSSNPFEASLSSLHPTMASTAPRTPTVTHHLLKTDGVHDTTPLATPTIGQPAAPATTQLSLNPPEFTLKSAPPLRRNHSHTPSIKEKEPQAGATSSRGQLHVKLIAARGLNVTSSRARPYVVVQFEQSEFISRDPIAESDAPVRGVPAALSRVSSAVNVTATKESGLARTIAANTPGSSVSSGSSNGLGSTPSHNPVWKHEVAFDVTQDNTMITFTVYDRQEEDEAFLGMLELKPVLKHDHTVDQWINFNGPNGGGKGLEITNNGAAKKAQRERGSPLTKSVQENFRGFTYSGESVVARAAGILDDNDSYEPEEDDVEEEGEEAGTDSEWEDESPAGRTLARPLSTLLARFSTFASVLAPKKMHNGDYPGQAFFGVYKGRKQRVESTYNQLLANVQDYPGAIYEAFMNRAHATQFSKTGQIPEGAVPVKPGMSRTTISPGISRTMSTPLSVKPAPVDIKPKSSSMDDAVERKPVLGQSQVASGSKPSGRGIRITAALARGATSANTREVQVWTDGSCLGNGKEGATAAYAVYFGPGDPRNEAKRVPGPQTNNTGEILAVIRALEIVDEGVKHMTLYTDSKYAIECLGWLPGWKKRGGMNSSNKPAVHYTMVKYMDALIQRREGRFKIEHVRAHQDNAGNNAADEMARLAAQGHSIPPNRDWELECVRLQKKPLVPVAASPKIAAVDSTRVKVEDDDSDYGYSDIELGDADIDGVDSPVNGNPSDRSVATRDTSLSDDRSAAGKKRARNEPAEEAPDSDVDRKGAKKKVKEQRVKCPECKHKFNVTLRT